MAGRIPGWHAAVARSTTLIDMREYLEPTEIIDSEHPDIVAFARARVEEWKDGDRDSGKTPADPRAAAVALYHAVRDGLRYDPYNAGLDVPSLRASNVLASGRGWCVAKAVVLTASCRAVGIPARLGFADVRNHLSTERLRAMMKTDVFYYHGYSSIHLGGRWVKATPAFNIELCEKFRLLPLEFDGVEDSLYHPFDAEGNQHMEYLRDHGEYPDVPLEEIRKKLREAYPGMGFGLEGADFDRDVEVETST